MITSVAVACTVGACIWQIYRPFYLAMLGINFCFAGLMMLHHFKHATNNNGAQVYLQPTGLLSATGLAVQTPFLRSLLDKWNVRATVIRREEYKNAANSITETDYTPAHRQATEELLQSFMSGITAGIASERKLTQAEVSQAAEVHAVKQRTS